MEFRLPDLIGKKVYAAKTIALYRSSKAGEKPFRKVAAGALIGKLDRYKLDVKDVKPTDLKSIKNARVWFVFKDSTGKDYGFKFIPGAKQINLNKFVDQGVKTEEQYQAETKKAYEKSPTEALSESSLTFLKKYGALIAAGLVTIILIKK